MTDRKTVAASVAASDGSLTLSEANGTAPAYMCFNPACARLGTHFPVILFGPAGRVPGQPLPYRLEVPKAACLGCQPSFHADVFVTEQARSKIEAFLHQHHKPMPDYSRLFVVWKSVAGPDWMEVKEAGEARFFF